MKLIQNAVCTFQRRLHNLLGVTGAAAYLDQIYPRVKDVKDAFGWMDG